MIDEIENLMSGIRHVSDNIAHDLRTPLTRLRNRLEQLQISFEHNNPYQQQIEQAIGDADQLLSTFAALLRIARIEAGGHIANISTVNLTTLATDAAELYEALAEEKKLQFMVEASTVIMVDGDRDLLFQALINLLDNAIKYTPAHGTVSVCLNRVGSKADITVSDTGMGIDAAERDKVGQRFYRLQHSRNTPGSGLGLSLVKAVAKLHHARLQLDDNGPGLKATLRLPISRD